MVTIFPLAGDKRYFSILFSFGPWTCHPVIPTLPRPHTDVLSVTSLSHGLTHTHIPSPTLIHSHSFAHTHPRSHPRSLMPHHTHAHRPSLSCSHTCTHPHTHTPSLIHAHVLTTHTHSVYPLNTLTFTLTNAYSHLLTHAHFCSFTCTHSLAHFCSP